MAEEVVRECFNCKKYIYIPENINRSSERYYCENCFEAAEKDFMKIK